MTSTTRRPIGGRPRAADDPACRHSGLVVAPIVAIVRQNEETVGRWFGLLESRYHRSRSCARPIHRTKRRRPAPNSKRRSRHRKRADCGIEDSQQNVERREQERLRIGNLRPAGKNVRRPPASSSVMSGSESGPPSPSTRALACPWSKGRAAGLGMSRGNGK
jgi:hypothetical protein